MPTSLLFFWSSSIALTIRVFEPVVSGESPAQAEEVEGHLSGSEMSQH